MTGVTGFGNLADERCHVIMDRQITETNLQLSKFLSELTELSNKYAIAITGEPTLFVMEPEDRQFTYRVDDVSRLSFG